ncbi:hypothetical protein EDM57_04665 [Brevibacillus gelatini]|uniref:Uncharacterized protein n=1 Tax=Brevibacillus gelatini TaxID=1655277 RepID=A0A3M8B7N6_9BACL|nr:hypothetical protein [Brevibacillus gelatini]RNB59438.1 hypothetical protein EDM57_04665 [Brevibacillus gelatini]
MTKTATSANTLEEIIRMIPVEVNMIKEIDFDREIENKNNKPYVYYNVNSGELKVFRVCRKNLETVLVAYDYGLLQSPYVSNFEAHLFLDKERDGKAIKVLPSEVQKQIRNSMFGCASFNNATEFQTVLLLIKDKINWVL